MSDEPLMIINPRSARTKEGLQRLEQQVAQLAAQERTAAQRYQELNGEASAAAARLANLDHEVRQITEIVAQRVLDGGARDFSAIEALHETRRRLAVEVSVLVRAAALAQRKYSRATNELNSMREQHIQALTATAPKVIR